MELLESARKINKEELEASAMVVDEEVKKEGDKEKEKAVEPVAINTAKENNEDNGVVVI